MKNRANANRFLIEALVDLFPFRTPVSVSILAALFYVPGLLLARFSGIDLSAFSFLSDNKSFCLVAVAIPVFSSIAKYGSSSLAPVFEQARKCFDVSDQVFSDLIAKLDRTVKSTRGVLVVSSFLEVLLLAEIWRYYPRPILRIASSYTYFDWYVVSLFLLGMFVIGTGFWGALSGSYVLLHDQKMPIHLDMVRELNPVTRLVLLLVIAWSIGTGMTYVALPIGYGFAAILIGYGFFGIYQYSIHRSIMIQKNQFLKALRSVFYISTKGLLDTQDSDTLLRRSQIVEAYGATLERVESMKEWPIDYSSVAKLASSGILALGLRYLLVGSI